MAKDRPTTQEELLVLCHSAVAAAPIVIKIRPRSYEQGICISVLFAVENYVGFVPEAVQHPPPSADTALQKR